MSSYLYLLPGILTGQSKPDKGSAAEKPVCTPSKEPPQKPPVKYPAAAFQSCPQSVPYELNPATSYKLPFNKDVEGKFWQYLENTVGFYNIEDLTWEQAAAFIYNIKDPKGNNYITDPKNPNVVKGAKLLKERNGGEATPYKTLPLSTRADYVAYCYTRWIPTNLLKFGNIPAIPLEVPSLTVTPVTTVPAADPCKDIETSDLEKAVKNLDKRIGYAEGVVGKQNCTIKYGKGVTGKDAIGKAKGIKAQADIVLKTANDLISKKCQNPGAASKDLSDALNKVNEALKNLSVHCEEEEDSTRLRPKI